MKKLLILLPVFFVAPAFGASIVASVNGTPITDTDITARTKLMARQGKTSTDNRRVALQNIIDDNVKLAYATNFGAVPDDKTVDTEFKKMKLGDLSASEREMARNALRSEIAWQVIVARTILPTIDVSAEDIASERANLAREHGLPIEMAEKLGGIPQKFTAMQYELSSDIRERVATLPKLTWSSRMDNSVLLVCDTKKTAEYKNLDEIIKQNATYKQAMFMADQQLKQLRRRAVIVINDDRYKL